ncbi:hypothetical protein V8E51_010616 [Hyaloscypha variabilis]
MTDSSINQTIVVPPDILQSLLTSVNSLQTSVNNLQNEVSLLRQEHKATKDVVSTIQTTINTEFDSPTERGAFDVFPGLPIEVQHMIWDSALEIPRVVGARIVVQDGGDAEEVLVPTAPNSPILFVNKEARDRAKKILVRFTNTNASNRGRVPLLYLNPEVDTLWVVNYTPERAREWRISNSVVFGPRPRLCKVAIPFETWKSLDWSDEYDTTAHFMALFHDKGIKEIVLIVGGDDAAMHTDVVLVRPREIVEDYIGGNSVQELKAIYAWPYDELLRWSLTERHTNEMLDITLDIYMQNEEITKDDPVDSQNKVHNIMIRWAKGAWKPPVFKFMEAKRRKELVSLNISN